MLHYYTLRTRIVPTKYVNRKFTKHKYVFEFYKPRMPRLLSGSNSTKIAASAGSNSTKIAASAKLI